MAKVHSIRRQIKAVQSVKQITKAMEMVAASKLRRSQEATLRTRLYVTRAREALARVRQFTSTLTHPLFIERPVQAKLVIIFSSDRGLAGAYNSNVFKQLLQLEPPVSVIAVGQKGANFVNKFKDKFNLIAAYTNWPTTPTLNDIRPIATTAITGYQQGLYDQVYVLYTDFISTVQQQVTSRLLLPIKPDDLVLPENELGAIEDRVLFEPSPQDVVDYIVPRILQMQFFQASLEAAASEQSMRMVAMKNATDNASDLIDDLTLTYNGARQATITQELAEITSGAAAIT